MTQAGGEAPGAVWGVVDIIGRELHQRKEELQQAHASLDGLVLENRKLQQEVELLREQLRAGLRGNPQFPGDPQSSSIWCLSGQCSASKEAKSLRYQLQEAKEECESLRARLETQEEEAQQQANMVVQATREASTSHFHATEQTVNRAFPIPSSGVQFGGPERALEPPGPPPSIPNHLGEKVNEQATLPQAAVSAKRNGPKPLTASQMVFKSLPQSVVGVELPNWSKVKPCIPSRAGNRDPLSLLPSDIFRTCNTYPPLYSQYKVIWTSEDNAPYHATIFAPATLNDPSQPQGQKWARNTIFSPHLGQTRELFCDLFPSVVYYVGTYECLGEEQISYSDDRIPDQIRKSLRRDTISPAWGWEDANSRAKGTALQVIDGEYKLGSVKVIALRLRCVGWNRTLYAKLESGMKEAVKAKMKNGPGDGGSKSKKRKARQEDELGDKEEGSSQGRKKVILDELEFLLP